MIRRRALPLPEQRTSGAAIDSCATFFSTCSVLEQTPMITGSFQPRGDRTDQQSLWVEHSASIRTVGLRQMVGHPLRANDGIHGVQECRSIWAGSAPLGRCCRSGASQRHASLERPPLKPSRRAQGAQLMRVKSVRRLGAPAAAVVPTPPAAVSRPFFAASRNDVSSRGAAGSGTASPQSTTAIVGASLAVVAVLIVVVASGLARDGGRLDSLTPVSNRIIRAHRPA